MEKISKDLLITTNEPYLIKIENGISNKNLSLLKKNNSIYEYFLNGFANLGNTCYMNSALQVLLHFRHFVIYLLENKNEIKTIIASNSQKIFNNRDFIDKNNELKNKIMEETYSWDILSKEEIDILFNNTITGQIINLLEKMYLNKNTAIIPREFRQIFGIINNNYFYNSGQQDSEDAYLCIIQNIQDELSENVNVIFSMDKESVIKFIEKKNQYSQMLEENNDLDSKKKIILQYLNYKKNNYGDAIIMDSFREIKKHYDINFSFITEMFYGFLCSETSCTNLNCRNISNKIEPFLHLSVPCPNTLFTNIYECLDIYFGEELLDIGNEWLCDICKNKVRAKKKMNLWIAPPLLGIHIKRFSGDYYSKNNIFVDSPLEDLDISKYIYPDLYNKNKIYKYDLVSVINHVGSLNGGHYYTFSSSNKNEWYIFDDSHVSRIPKENIISKNSYVLFYVRKDI